MLQPSRQPYQLARRIVEHEAGGSTDAAASAAAVEAACRRLSDHLVDLLGSSGVAALLKRALRLAQREQFSLSLASTEGKSGECFIGLATSLDGSSDEDARAAAVAILANMIELLVMLLGEELAMKPLRKLWPQSTNARESDV